MPYICNMKGKDLNIFVRFGGVNIKKQKGYSQSPRTFHSPPAPRGFYAMPKIAQELFLISSMERYQPSAVPKIPKKEICGEDEEGIPICADITEEQWDEFHRRRDIAIHAMRKEFTKRRGNIWHHLVDQVKPSDVIASHGSWVKTDLESWKKAISKISLKYRYGDSGTFGGTMSITSINETMRSGLFGYYSRDEFEVFFDEKV